MTNGSLGEYFISMTDHQLDYAYLEGDIQHDHHLTVLVDVGHQVLLTRLWILLAHDETRRGYSRVGHLLCCSMNYVLVGMTFDRIDHSILERWKMSVTQIGQGWRLWFITIRVHEREDRVDRRR